MGLRNWLFGDSGCDNGCTNHHFGELTIDVTKSTLYKTYVTTKNDDGSEEDIDAYYFNVVETATCQHGGCDEEKVKHTVRRKYIPADEVYTGSGIYHEYEQNT